MSSQSQLGGHLSELHPHLLPHKIPTGCASRYSQKPNYLRNSLVVPCSFFLNNFRCLWFKNSFACQCCQKMLIRSNCNALVQIDAHSENASLIKPIEKYFTSASQEEQGIAPKVEKPRPNWRLLNIQIMITTTTNQQ